LVCDLKLDLRNYGSVEGKIYCKNHLKEIQTATIDDKRKSIVITSPLSFIPEPNDSYNSESLRNEPSEATIAKFKKFREEGEANKCDACKNPVFIAERLVLEDKNEKRLFHKLCFRCSVCELQLDLRNCGSVGGVVYCKNHLKEAQAGQQKTVISSYVATPVSFIPEVLSEKPAEKNQTPDHISAKFKGLGASGEKCKSCGKTVYSVEKVVAEGLNKPANIYHKQCLKCSHCDVKLDVSSYGMANGVLFCNIHLKQFGKPEQVKSENSYFISPLSLKPESYQPGPPVDNVDSDSRTEKSEEPSSVASSFQGDTLPSVSSDSDERNLKERRKSRQDQPHSEQPQQLPETVITLESSEVIINDREEERRKRREEREKARVEEEKVFQEEKARKEKEREERRRQREEQEKVEDEERERKADERRKEREEKKKKLEELVAKEEELQKTEPGKESIDKLPTDSEI